MKKIITIALTAMCTLILHEQVGAQMQMENSMSQYYHNKMLWNAGYTGAGEKKTATFVVQVKGEAPVKGKIRLSSTRGGFIEKEFTLSN